MVNTYEQYIKFNKLDIPHNNVFLENIREEFLFNAKQFFGWRESQNNKIKNNDFIGAFAHELEIYTDRGIISAKKELYNSYDYEILIEIAKKIIKKYHNSIYTSIPQNRFIENGIKYGYDCMYSLINKDCLIIDENYSKKELIKGYFNIVDYYIEKYSESVEHNYGYKAELVFYSIKPYIDNYVKSINGLMALRIGHKCKL